MLTDSVSSANEASRIAEIDIAKFYLHFYLPHLKHENRLGNVPLRKHQFKVNSIKHENCLKNVPLRKHQFKVNLMKLSLVIGLLFDGLTFFT